MADFTDVVVIEPDLALLPTADEVMPGPAFVLAEAPLLVFGLPDDIASLGDLVPPVLTVAPAGGAISADAELQVYAVDDRALALVTVTLGDRVVFDGHSFTSEYLGSTVVTTSTSTTLVLRRSGGWPPGSFTLTAFCMDRGGNDVSHVLTFSAPSAGGGGDVSSFSHEHKVDVRRWVDAKTRDYVVEAGRLRQDDGFTSDVVLALSTRLGSAQCFPEFGSRLYEIKRADEQGRKLAEAHALKALEHLTKKVRDLKVVAALPEKRPGQIDLEVSGTKGYQVVRATYTAVLR